MEERDARTSSLPIPRAETRESPRSGDAVSPPAIQPPKGGGAIRGIGEKFAVSPATGTASLTVPLPLSPSRSGFTPRVSLAYDSGSGNGPFGFGWGLSVPSISRRTDKGLPRYLDDSNSDVFLISNAEDLVPVRKQVGSQWQPVTQERTVHGQVYRIDFYRPRTEGLFARIERWTRLSDGDTHWRSISRENVTSLYGSDTSARIADPQDGRRVFRWLLCAVYDDKGNAARYVYIPENLNNVDPDLPHERHRFDTLAPFAYCYPQRILYGNRDPLQPGGDPSALDSWRFEAVFDYGDHSPNAPQLAPDRTWPVRSDPFSSYRAGFEMRSYRLCRRVLMFHHFADAQPPFDDLVRTLDFTYTETPVASYLNQVTLRGYKRQGDGSYLTRSYPPLEMEYTQPTIDDTLREIDSVSLENLPVGAAERRCRWADLDGEGLSGLLTAQPDAWYYKRNLSSLPPDCSAQAVARFAPQERIASLPAPASGDDAPQFLDLNGDGLLDLADFDRSAPGFYARTEDDDWDAFLPFAALPNVDWQDPNLRLVDLTGDGFADVLVTGDEIFTWYPSLAEAGFGPSEYVRQPFEEEQGPRLVFADGTQSVYLADMSGDGLSDLVCIGNGEIYYRPNLGYGRFGAKLTMTNAPVFDAPDQFNPQCIRLADIDGSGTSDILYLHRDGARLYFNQSGNGWSDARPLAVAPPTEDLSAVQTVDLLGNGTACLVFSSVLPEDAPHAMRYIDLMSGQKPHLLTLVRNNLGAETRFHYAPSTRFYLQDREAGWPWITKLPFPVQVVERMETYDRISRSRFVSRYAYHHGRYDGVEREFCGFGMVEQWDTEEIGSIPPEVLSSEEVANLDAASFVPPALTRTWYHTGAFVETQRLEGYYREKEYYQGDSKARFLDDSPLPAGLTGEEEREACRALKGMLLRQEVYVLDDTAKSAHPYLVTEQNYGVRLLQPRADNPHAVFFTHEQEKLEHHYERNPDDPRVSHQVTLQVDDYGNVLTAAVAYSRRGVVGEPEQFALHATLSQNQVTNAILDADAYRTPLPCDARVYELIRLTA